VTELDVQSFYAWFGKPAPKMIWCESPWQMACLYMLMRMGLVEHEPPGSPPRFRKTRDHLLHKFSQEFADRTTSHLSSSKFFPVTDVQPKGEFFPGRLPVISPLIRPLGSETPNTIIFTRSLMMDVGYGGRNKLRRSMEDFRRRQGGLSLLPQMLAEWSQRLGRTFADEATREMMAHYTGGWSLGRPSPFLLRDFYRDHKSNFFAECAVGMANLLWFGAWAGDWLPIYDFLLEAKALPDQDEANELSIWLDLARNAPAYIFFDKVCLVSERPTAMHLDHRGRLHAQLEPALRFADGYELHSWHGVTCDKDLIEHPERLTPSDIENESNSEIKRVMMEMFGFERYLTSSFGSLIHQDECGILYSRPLGGRDEPLTMVRVKNSTPEPDGTYKEYFLRVPPTIKTAREAVAWTFEMDENEYKPKFES
jgi:hypothetical protein